MSTVYSHSRLSSFENCKKQFHFRYILKLPQETEGIEAFVGKRVHEVLERLYEFVGREQLPSLEKVIARYQTLWDEHFDIGRVRIVKRGTSVAFYRELGSLCLDHFYRKHYPFDADETLGLEERVLFDLDDAGRYRMQGIIDRIARNRDGTVEIQDYKTGAWVPSQKKLDEDRQLALYQIALADRFGADQPMRLVWHYVQKRQIRTSMRTPEQLEALKHETRSLIDRVESEQEFPANKNNLCSWCEYKSVCPLFAEPEVSAAIEGEAASRAAPAVRQSTPPREKPTETPASPGRSDQLDLL